MFLSYKEEIMSIAHENTVSIDIGLDMFIANIEKGEDCRKHEYFYQSDLANKLNYDILKSEYDALNDDEKQQARAEFLESFCEKQNA